MEIVALLTVFTWSSSNSQLEMLGDLNFRTRHGNHDYGKHG